eukprot:TRINITY_DN1552_c0_g1_i10.p1 TRINITY_DN1552_c0_g1~~TRINITY_DN1552_c0_g1_i10.p1  ORF type:complete len:229 (+),score=-20.85 TRINITY_DN1552_c0_g1_i10:1116-1802(+)
MIFNIVVDLYSFKNNNNSKVMFIDLGTSRCNQSNLLKLYYCIKLLIDLGFFEKFYTPTLQCTPVIRTPFITTTSIQQHFLWERKHKCYFLIILLPLQRHQLPLQQQFETPKNVTPRSKCTTRATCIHILEENKNCTPSKTQEFIHQCQQHKQLQYGYKDTPVITTFFPGTKCVDIMRVHCTYILIKMLSQFRKLEANTYLAKDMLRITFSQKILNLFHGFQNLKIEDL